MNHQELRGQLSRGWYQKEYGVANILTTNISQAVSRHISKKTVLSVADELIRDEFIVKKPTGYGLQVYLNTHMKDKIQEYLE
ncbi:MAG: hypothetical protein DRN71_05900 [Candidatus Nanohalarchaeota archaeon]|nr:MAG: hypothetical protein DRN71_05900 [Candidatus Nanohaloarchaeota archaeon]